MSKYGTDELVGKPKLPNNRRYFYTTTFMFGMQMRSCYIGVSTALMPVSKIGSNSKPVRVVDVSSQPAGTGFYRPVLLLWLVKSPDSPRYLHLVLFDWHHLVDGIDERSATRESSLYVKQQSTPKVQGRRSSSCPYIDIVSPGQHGIESPIASPRRLNDLIFIFKKILRL